MASYCTNETIGICAIASGDLARRCHKSKCNRDLIAPSFLPVDTIVSIVYVVGVQSGFRTSGR